MRILKVDKVEFSGTHLETYVVLEDGPLGDDSVVLAPSLFLLDQAQAGRSVNTLKAKADDLKSLFQAISAHSQDWTQLTDQDMSGYLQGYLKQDRDLSDEAVERHISTVKSFYSFAWDSGLLLEPKPYKYYYRSSKINKQGQGSSGAKLDLSVKYINKQYFELICSNLLAQDPFLRERDELVMSLGFYCGLRSAEITDPRNLDSKSMLEELSKAERLGENTITLRIIGKGEKSRRVVIPPPAVRKIRIFLTGRRSNLLPGPLICSKKGKHLSTGHASDVFGQALKASIHKYASLTSSLETMHPCPYLLTPADFSKLSFHCLRHTYATNLVDFCYKYGIDPWVYVQEQLGHERRKTTREYIVFDAQMYGREKITRALQDDE
jgi:site-specific recombinase XerD